MTNLYTPDFYDTIRPGVQSSAAALVPVMADMVYVGDGATVADVGCGEGWWAREWVTSGHARAADGFDGPWPRCGTALEDDIRLDFVPISLDALGPPAPHYGYDYDIALCLEVAEHLDRPDPLLAWLRNLAPVVFFSAAVPGQPGAGHVSCRWQADWAENFKDAGWHTVDPRPLIWGDGRVEWWYRQNLFVAFDPNVANIGPDEPILSMIHPEMWDVRRFCR